MGAKKNNRKKKQPPVPSERAETVRQEIVEVLEGGALTARDISINVGEREREVYDHLAHIQRSLDRQGRALVVTPSECRKCGFVFRKRERLRKPGKCPACRGQSITEPLFSVRG
jgi:predicted Zn-ribbon and HTH transcriptional regulator